MKRIILLGTVVALVVAMVIASSLSVTAQVDEYATETGQAIVCAPWSKAWDVSKGSWWFQWYRWCYDPALYDPAYESSWYQEVGDWQWADQVNLCPEEGTCTMTPGGGMRMTTS